MTNNHQTPEKPGNGGKWMIALVVACACLLLIDGWIHKHGPYAIEHWWGFYGLYSFLACLGVAIVAIALRFFVKRGEDYYDQ